MTKTNRLMVHAALWGCVTCPLSLTATAGEGGSAAHWSEGMYFPPTTHSGVGGGYSGDASRPTNPWHGYSGGGPTSRLPSAESLGYPRQGYDPYYEGQSAREPHPYNHHSATAEARYPRADSGRYVERYGEESYRYPPLQYGGEYRPGAEAPNRYPSNSADGYGAYSFAPSTSPYGQGGYVTPYPALNPSYMLDLPMGGTPGLGLLPFSATGIPFW